MSSFLLDGPKKDLLERVKRMGELSIDDAAEQLNLAKTTVRQHLLQMERQGLVHRKYQKSGQGRPKLAFALSAAGQRLYPTQEPTLLRELLQFLEANGYRNTVQQFFQAYWAKRRDQFEMILASIGGKKTDQDARLEALRALLEAEGFMPQIERGAGKKLTVRECNCPFPEAIRATQLPCKLESEFIRWALKASIDRTSYIPSGDPACTYSENRKKPDKT